MGAATDYVLIVRYRKLQHELQLCVDAPTLGQIASAIASVTAAHPETIKLLLPGRKGHMLKLMSDPTETAHNVGLKSGARVEVYASTRQEVEQVRNSKDLPGLAGFEQELKQTMRRHRGSKRGVLTLPTGPYTFQKFEGWQHPGLSPVPSEALKLLHRLAADPGIFGIMSKHRWTVGLLSEMPPEGKVGVSPMCILGVNINAGQEISLRLRTDDLKGFRRYDRIRETLCHELAHMVWSKHDNRFKQLNSQLLKECNELDWTSHAGHAVSGLNDPAFENPAEPSWVDEDDIMAVTAQSSGQTLRQLASDGQHPGHSGHVLADPRRAAAMAASARLASVSPSPSSSRSASPGISRSASPSKTDLGVGSATATAAASPSSSGAVAVTEVALNPSDAIASMGHHDPGTEQAEEAMRALGSMEFASEAESVDSQNTADHLQQESWQRDASGSEAQQQQQRQQQQAKVGVPPTIENEAVGVSHWRQSADRQSPEAASNAASHSQMASLAPACEHAQHSATAQEAAQTADTKDSHMADAVESPELQTAGGPEAASQQNDIVSETGSEDPAVQRYRQAEAAVAQLTSQAGNAAGQRAALQTLSKILQNIVRHPGEAKYSHIRLGNAVFHSRAGQFPAARELLRVAGFTEEAEGSADRALVWKRNDQGLLWLTLSAVDNALQYPM